MLRPKRQKLTDISGQSISCVLFDLGSTLWYRDAEVVKELEGHANQQAINLLRQFIKPLPLPGKDDIEAGKLLRKAIKRQFKEEIERDPAIEPEGAQIVQQVLHKACNSVHDKDLCQAIFDTLDIPIRHSRRFFADTLSTLQEMRKRSLQLGIVTNRHWGGSFFRDDLHPLGLTNYIGLEKTMISADLRIRKPNPEIYRRALKACQVGNETTMMVGDSLTADIAGAQHQHIFAVWKPKYYNKVSAYLAAAENITIAEYNMQQLYRLKEQGRVKKQELIYMPKQKDEDISSFLNGAIRPQLIIKDLEELLAWL